MKKIRVLFVCMGNICRSPTAEGVFRHYVDTAGLGRDIWVDSAGTHGYHTGEAPDSRSQAAALRRGIDISKQRARKVVAADFSRFQLILAMDERNLASLRRDCPPEQHHKLQLLLDFRYRFIEREVPDPYYGGVGGFDRVLDLIEDASVGLLEHLKRRLQMETLPR